MTEDPVKQLDKNLGLNVMNIFYSEKKTLGKNLHVIMVISYPGTACIRTFSMAFTHVTMVTLKMYMFVLVIVAPCFYIHVINI